LKVKVLDAQRASEIIRKDYFESTGINSTDLPGEETVFDADAETVVCPACSTQFNPASKSCPECGLQFG